MAEKDVTRDELESRIRSLGLEVKESLGLTKAPTAVVGAVAGGLAIVGSYLLGRRKGRKRATVLEVRRG